jgi:hypothetical protein
VILGKLPNTEPSGGLIKTGAARVGVVVGTGAGVGGDVGVAVGGPETRGAVPGV